MKSLLLTEREEQTLRMFLLMTTNYRRGEQESCASLATETNEDGTLIFPKMENNAQWWQDCIETIDAITAKMEIRGGGIPLEVAEAGLYGRYRNMLADVRAGFAKVTILQERAFYDGMLQMLELLGGYCKVSEHGFHSISFSDGDGESELPPHSKTAAHCGRRDIL